MKTKIPADPAKLRELSRALQRIARKQPELALHVQLRFAILQCIHAGSWVAGDRLPPETDLAAAAGLSMGTVQRALRDLSDQGVIRRQQGSGSFIAGAPNRIDDVTHCRFLGDDRSSVLPVFSRVLARKPAAAKGPWAPYFPAGAALLRLDRVLNVNDEFDVYSRFFFDGGRFTGLASRPVDELAGANFRVLLGQEGKLPAGAMSQTMRLVQAPADVARHIGVIEGNWVAQMDIVRHVSGGTAALYYQQMFVPPTSRELVTREST